MSNETGEINVVVDLSNKGLVNQKGKSPVKLATILRATKEKKQEKNRKRKTTLQTCKTSSC